MCDIKSAVQLNWTELNHLGSSNGSPGLYSLPTWPWKRQSTANTKHRKSTKNKWKIQANDVQWPTEVDLLYDEGEESEVKGTAGQLKDPSIIYFWIIQAEAGVGKEQDTPHSTLLTRLWEP